MKRIESLLRAHEMAARHREKVAKAGKVPLVDGKTPLFAKKADARGALYLYEVIGIDWWTGGGTTGKSVADALGALKAEGVKALDIFINSEGGDVFQADAIYTNLKRFDGEKVVYVDGIAASAASFIAMVGDRIVFSPVSMMMIHEASAGAYGRADDFRATADLLDKANQTLAETYAKRTGRTVDECLSWMNDELWMTAKEAKDKGFCDEISQDDESDDTVAAAKSAPFIALAAQTQERSRLARQAYRLNDLKTRAGQPAKERSTPASR